MRKAYYCIIALFCNISYSVYGQDQRTADSLVKLYRDGNLADTAKLELLRILSFNEVRDLNLSLKYAEELITLSRRLRNNLYLHRGYFQKGNKKRLLGDLHEALDAYFKSADAASKAKYTPGEGTAYGAIADVYGISHDHSNAMVYYNKAIAVLRRSGDSIRLASAILNAGDEYRNTKNYDSALLYFKEAQLVFEKLNYLAGKAYSVGNIGMVYASIGNNKLAAKYINEAIPILEKLEDYSPICVYLLSLSDVYLQKGDKATALNYALRSSHLAHQYNFKEQIRDADLKLSELYEAFGKPEESLRYYKNYTLYRDSLDDINYVKEMADMRTNFEISQKQTEVNLLTQQKINQRTINVALLIILGLTVLLLATLFWYSRNITRQKKRSEHLLLNILPAQTAQELKQDGKVNAVKFEQVTVLFTDFVEFTRIAEMVEPEQLVKSIDYYFKAFDEICIKNGLEKIKTVGDSYMCACGLPMANPTHARNVVIAAKEMTELVNRSFMSKDGLSHFEIRVGINTGPVVAGIVGIKKWQYDIWGDAVNIASRMQSMSLPGRINLSEKTYLEIKDEFPCEYRGEFTVKNHGPLKMYFLC